MLFSRILLTGANGLLGQQLVEVLSRRQEYDVLATARDASPKFTGGACGYVPLDITNAGEVRRIFQDFTPDVVINSAAMTQVDDCEIDREACWRINVDAVEYLARTCLTYGSRFIQVSTDFIFDGQEGPYAEDARPNPLSFYGRSKLAAENAVRNMWIDNWAIARTVLVYGTGENLSRSNFVLWVINKLQDGQQINVVTDQWRTPTYAPDLADGIERIVRFNKSGIYHLSGRELLSVYDIAREVADVFGLDGSLIRPADSRSFKQTAARPPRTGFLILKAESELGYKPLPLREALAALGEKLGIPTPGY